MANRKGALDEIPNSGTLPAGDYLCVVNEFEERRTKDTAQNPNALMYNVDYEVTEPEELAGRHHFENYRIGTKEDPEADDPKTWKKSMAARLLKLHMQRAGVETSGKTVEEAAPEFKQRKIGLVIIEKDDDDGTPRNRIKKAMSPGEFTPRLHGDNEGSAAVAAASAPRAAAPVVEDVSPPATPTPAAAPAESPAPVREAAKSGKAGGRQKTYRCRECDSDEATFTDKQLYYDHLAAHDE